jgi:N-alpha-acetyl-L-2,4-diaminobutyrate deacetylase
MARAIVLPADLDLDSPGRRDYLVALEHDSIWGDHLLPLTVLVGPQARPGQGLVAFGANHGNEYEGPVILKHLLEELRAEDVLGRIILVPILNVPAFLSGTRESVAEDGVNLNRAFVTGAGEHPALCGITHRIAAFVRTHLWPHVHVVVDLHAGGEVAKFALCVTFNPDGDGQRRQAIEETARWFGTPFISSLQAHTPGVLFSEAQRLGKITVSNELGWGRALNREGLRCGRQGVLAAAIRSGQLRGDLRPIGHHAAGTQRHVAMVDRRCFVVSPFRGHYEPRVDCGEPVRAGQVLGLVHDFEHLDDPGWPALAEVDGWLMAHAWGAPVVRGQHIAVVGTPVG